MRTLYHPNMRDTSIEVEDDRVAEFTAQGWRKTPPKKKSEAPKPAPDNTDSPASGEDTDKEVS